VWHHTASSQQPSRIGRSKSLPIPASQRSRPRRRPRAWRAWRTCVSSHPPRALVRVVWVTRWSSAVAPWSYRSKKSKRRARPSEAWRGATSHTRDAPVDLLVSFPSHLFSSARIARHDSERLVKASVTLVDTVNPLHLLPRSLFRISLAERIDSIPSVPILLPLQNCFKAVAEPSAREALTSLLSFVNQTLLCSLLRLASFPLTRLPSSLSTPPCPPRPPRETSSTYSQGTTGDQASA
jgi:hypothetical protein